MKQIDLKRLYELAGGQALVLEEGLYHFTGLMRKDQPFREYFENEAVPQEKKKELFSALEPAAPAIVKDFISFIIENRLGRALVKLSNDFTREVAAREGIVFATVQSAMPVEEKERQEIKKYLGDQVCLRQEIDLSLIGGLRFWTSDGRYFDGSLRGAINKLKEKVAYA